MIQALYAHMNNKTIKKKKTLSSKRVLENGYQHVEEWE
jgi:hypothetical protein